MEKTHITSKGIGLFLLRIALGWLFLYSGITKILDPQWSAAQFLSGAKTFPAIFDWFSSSANIGWVNILNSWGQTLIGLSLISGTLVRLSSVFGALLMILYYLPALDFPLVKNGFLIDNHIIFILVFVIFIIERAGTFWGLDTFINKKLKSWWI